MYVKAWNFMGIYEARKTKKLVNELPKETGRQPQTIFSNTKK